MEERRENKGAVGKQAARALGWKDAARSYRTPMPRQCPSVPGARFCPGTATDGREQQCLAGPTCLGRVCHPLEPVLWSRVQNPSPTAVSSQRPQHHGRQQEHLCHRGTNPAGFPSLTEPCRIPILDTPSSDCSAGWMEPLCPGFEFAFSGRFLYRCLQDPEKAIPMEPPGLQSRSLSPFHHRPPRVETQHAHSPA